MSTDIAPTRDSDGLPPVPGDVLRSELQRHGMTQEQLATVLRRPRPTITEIVTGKKSITPEMARDLGHVFKNGAHFWLKLEMDYQLALLPHSNDDIKRRWRVHELAPVKELIRRGWIPRCDTDSQLEEQLCKFFGVQDIDEEPKIEVAARKAGRTTPLSPEQRAWCFRAATLASSQTVAQYVPARLEHLEAELRSLLAFPESVRKVARVLNAYGIRFVIIEHLPGAKIDGAAFWLDENSPVIALSIRIDRIDGFWFVLAHELSHIRHRDSLSIDSRLVGDDAEPSLSKESQEQRADNEAAALLIDPNELRSFILRVGPMYAKTRIIQFAHRIKVHPGIIVGQLQHRGEVGYSAHREMLVKVRDIVTATTITDGWGFSLPI